jgi:hypothetical protein
MARSACRRADQGTCPPNLAAATTLDSGGPFFLLPAVEPDLPQNRAGTEYYDESRKWAEIPPGFRDWSELEDKAALLRAWSPGIIHGLLQTEDYARALLSTMPGASDEAVTGRLHARMERQRRVILRDSPPAALFVVADDAAWCEHVAGGFVYTDQTVTSVLRLFDSLRAECYRASESAALIERMCGQWANGASPLTAGPTAETA